MIELPVYAGLFLAEEGRPPEEGGEQQQEIGTQTMHAHREREYAGIITSGGGATQVTQERRPGFHDHQHGGTALAAVDEMRGADAVGHNV